MEVPRRLLLLVPKGTTPEQIEVQRMAIQKQLESELDLSNFTLIDSGTWFSTCFPAVGTWDSWIWETVNGRDFTTRDVHFAGFIVTVSELGRASAAIVQLALRTNRVVLHWAPNTSLRQVTNVIERDGSNWRFGWEIRSQEL